MAKSGLRVIKTLPSASRQYKRWEAEVEKGLRPFVDRRVKEYQKLVSSWKSQHRPQFVGQLFKRGPTAISIRVIIRNASKVFNKYGTTIRQLWNMWNEGTRPHKIVPRFASVLRFEIGGKVIFTKLVRHPGTKGSGAEERINKRLAPGEKKAIRRVGRVAFRRLNK